MGFKGKKICYLPILLLIFTAFFLFIFGCTPPPGEKIATNEVPEPGTELNPTIESTQPSPQIESDNQGEKTDRSLSQLSPNPQRIEYQAEDGKNLIGYYYPSKYENAPMIVLMHWARGTQRDWCEIAPWLQNRSDELPSEMPGCSKSPAEFGGVEMAPWWDSSWFPKLPEEVSYGVFTFDFRGFGESESNKNGYTELSKDAAAALNTAANLEGVDPSRIVTMGASIGSDGAPDGCLLFNQISGGGCLGAFSLSPGGYLGMDYAEVVKDLESLEPPVRVWCLAAEFDHSSPKTCRSASGDLYRLEIYEGKEEHGMMLINPEIQPNPLDLFIEFLSQLINW
jgi:hypothetical protein